MTERIIPTVYELSVFAEACDPDSPTSPGGIWLTDLWSNWDEIRDEYDDIERMIWETADGAVPVSDYSCWQVFTDLGGWREDLLDHDLGRIAEAGGLTQIARVALCVMAERVVSALEMDRRVEETLESEA